VFVGPGAGFERDPGHTVRMAQIGEGASSTLMIAEAGEPMPWTKPAGKQREGHPTYSGGRVDVPQERTTGFEPATSSLGS
jgi:hypothetical protein